MRYVQCLGCRKLCYPGPRCAPCLARQRATYDRTRPATHALYSTAAWKRLSAEVRASTDRCFWCGKQTSRLVADHVIPLAERPDLGYERTNLKPSCYACNNRRARNLAPVRYQQTTVDAAIAHVRGGTPSTYDLTAPYTSGHPSRKTSTFSGDDA